ncbi:hypothetical protein SUGI_0466570 [Cryptomeria japonica]|nr:hypothetical protein SUGI_0466570 [Cryptomeria japonica]
MLSWHSYPTSPGSKSIVVILFFRKGRGVHTEHGRCINQYEKKMFKSIKRTGRRFRFFIFQQIVESALRILMLYISANDIKDRSVHT